MGDLTGLQERAIQDSRSWFPNVHKSQQTAVVHFALGLAGEVGELVNLIKNSDDGGPELAGEVAAGRAVDIMYELFVAPKDMPKASGLERLGLQKSDVADWERTGVALKTKAIGGPE